MCVSAYQEGATSKQKYCSSCRNILRTGARGADMCSIVVAHTQTTCHNFGEIGALKGTAGQEQSVTYHGGSDAIGLPWLEPLHEGLEDQLLENRAIGLRAQGTCRDGQHLCHCCQQLLVICILQQKANHLADFGQPARLITCADHGNNVTSSLVHHANQTLIKQY